MRGTLLAVGAFRPVATYASTVNVVPFFFDVLAYSAIFVLVVVFTLVQGPNPQGQQVLYVVGRQGNNNAMTDDAVIFRIEFATAFTPYAVCAG